MMKIKYIIGLFLLFFSWLFPIVILAQSIPVFQESDGVIIIEIESAVDYGSWELDTTRAGYTGSGYLHYKGVDFFNNPGNSPLRFQIAIEKTGRYRFQWHSLIAVGESHTEHNDSWLRFKDASDFYGRKNAEKVYPKGVGKTPNPEGSSSSGWLKIYQNIRDDWTWQTRTSDSDPHQIYVEFDTAGIYSLEVSGRSNGHAINRLALFHSDANEASVQDLTRSESDKLEVVAVRDVVLRNLKIWPTIARNQIYLDLTEDVPAGQYTYRIINSLGGQGASSSFQISAESETVIPIRHLPMGSYFIQLQTESIHYQGRFLKM